MCETARGETPTPFSHQKKDERRSGPLSEVGGDFKGILLPQRQDAESGRFAPGSSHDISPQAEALWQRQQQQAAAADAAISSSSNSSRSSRRDWRRGLRELAKVGRAKVLGNGAEILVIA